VPVSVLIAALFAIAPAVLPSGVGCATLPVGKATVPGAYSEGQNLRSYLPAVALLSSIPDHCRGKLTPRLSLPNSDKNITGRDKPLLLRFSKLSADSNEADHSDAKYQFIEAFTVPDSGR